MVGGGVSKFTKAEVASEMAKDTSIRVEEAKSRFSAI